MNHVYKKQKKQKSGFKLGVSGLPNTVIICIDLVCMKIYPSVCNKMHMTLDRLWSTAKKSVEI